MLIFKIIPCLSLYELWYSVYSVFLIIEFSIKFFMDENTKKEEFSYAYIKIIAALAGIEVIIAGRPSDNSGIDIILRAPGAINGLLSPSIDAQVKCVSTATIEEFFIKYSLKVKNYKRLVAPSQALQILILVIVPEEINTCLSITESGSVIRASAYWLNLQGKENTDNDETITIKIPKENLFTPNALKTIMKQQAERYKQLFSLDDEGIIE